MLKIIQFPVYPIIYFTFIITFLFNFSYVMFVEEDYEISDVSIPRPYRSGNYETILEFPYKSSLSIQIKHTY